MQTIHSKMLEQALCCNDRFPINLEWMVDVFKYKHISSLTTHLKRHFKQNVHYKRFSQEQNKRVWSYFISVDCFIGICEYVRHAARKKIANMWLRKVGIKGSTRRAAPREGFMGMECEDEMEDEEDEYGFDYYEGDIALQRRTEENDEDYHAEDDYEEDDEECTYFQEMEEEEVEYETDDSIDDYDSSSSSTDTPPRHPSAHTISYSRPLHPNMNVEYVNGRSAIMNSRSSLRSSTESYSSSSSSPSSPTGNGRTQLNNSSPCVANPSTGINNTNNLSTSTIRSAISPSFRSSPQSSPESSDGELCQEQVDWSYLHLRPNPHPLGVMLIEQQNRYIAPVMMPPQYCYVPIAGHNNMLAPNAFFNYNSLHYANIADLSSHSRHDGDHALQTAVEGDSRQQFDTNMFLSL